MQYIGVDLHSTQITVCYLENNDYVMLNEFDKFTAKLLPGDSIAVEATTNNNWFYDKFKTLVSKIVVVNSAIFKVIANSCNKTDENNAILLAKYLSNNMLPESKVKYVENARTHENYTTVTQIGMDEISIAKGHDYINSSLHCYPSYRA